MQDDMLEAFEAEPAYRPVPIKHLPEFQQLAMLFARGTWSKEPPTDPGLYPVASLEGGFIGYVLFVHRQTREGVRVPRFIRFFADRATPYQEGRQAKEVHVGFWWSHSVPPVPGVGDKAHFKKT